LGEVMSTKGLAESQPGSVGFGTSLMPGFLLSSTKGGGTPKNWKWRMPNQSPTKAIFGRVGLGRGAEENGKCVVESGETTSGSRRTEVRG
jgi:hypothetical protein